MFDRDWKSVTAFINRRIAAPARASLPPVN
jgi:hypothetical protein